MPPHENVESTLIWYKGTNYENYRTWTDALDRFLASMYRCFWSLVEDFLKFQCEICSKLYKISEWYTLNGYVDRICQIMWMTALCRPPAAEIWETFQWLISSNSRYNIWTDSVISKLFCFCIRGVLSTDNPKSNSIFSKAQSRGNFLLFNWIIPDLSDSVWNGSSNRTGFSYL